MGDELVAFFWERDDAEAVATLTDGTVQRERFHGEDDDEDHPWVVLLPAAVDSAELDDLLADHDGWLTHPPTPVQPAAPPPPLPPHPRRLKRT